MKVMSRMFPHLLILIVITFAFWSCQSPVDSTTENPVMITLALSKNTADPNDIETTRAITTGLDMTQSGELYTFARDVTFESTQFENGKTYYVEGVAGADTITIVDRYNDRAIKTFNIVSKNVQVINGATLCKVNVDITMPVNANGVPQSPYTNLRAVGSADGTVTGTPLLLIQNSNGTYYRL